MFQDQINAYFDDPARREALVAAISRLVSIRSVRGDAAPGMPFGAGPARALEEGLALCREMGFATRNYEGYVGTADLNDRETRLHILGHLDVVGEGTGWTVTAPYTPKLVGDLLYGRGTSDDKGPLVSALFALQAVRELGIPLQYNARIILGTDEESGSEDIAYYYKKEPYAPCTFTPDAEFPVINTEKGSYKPVFQKAWEPERATPRVTALSGGFRINVLPPDADAVVCGLSADAARPYFDKAAEETGCTFRLEEAGDDLHIFCHGAGAHAAMPETGNNANTALLHLLSALPLAALGSTAAVRALHALFPHGDHAGKGLGVAQRDEASGPLTLVLSLLTLKDCTLSGQFDCRVPLCGNEENCKAVTEAAFARFGFHAEGEMDPPHHTPGDSPFVQTLLRCYEQYSGNRGECLAIGGGTYVHHIPGGVAFGPGMPDFNGNMHGADEHTSVPDLLAACKIFTQAIADLCG